VASFDRQHGALHQDVMPLPLEPTVSVLIGSRNRPQALARCLRSVLELSYPRKEVVVLDDASTMNLAEACAAESRGATIRWLRSETRLGVAGGRNLLISKASGDIVVFIDDDAVFEDAGALDGVVRHFSANPSLGTVAFKIVVLENGRLDLKVPFSRRARKKNPRLSEEPTLVSYYLGGGHAIRKEVFSRCGLYQEDLIFGGEELDLAYRQVQQGYKLLYAPEILVHHFPEKPVIQAGGEARSELYYTLRNRIWLAYKYLPMPYLATYVGVWTLYFLAVALRQGRVGEFVRGVGVGFASLNGLPRVRLNREALRYLRMNHGRLWY
jgi:GT2 family glycosyltransferase